MRRDANPATNPRKRLIQMLHGVPRRGSNKIAQGKQFASRTSPGAPGLLLLAFPDQPSVGARLGYHIPRFQRGFARAELCRTAGTRLPPSRAVRCVPPLSPPRRIFDTRFVVPCQMDRRLFSTTSAGPFEALPGAEDFPESARSMVQSRPGRLARPRRFRTTAEPFPDTTPVSPAAIGHPGTFRT